MSKAKEYISNTLETLLIDINPQEEKKVICRMKLAARIDESRKKKGWNKKEFAKRLNKQPSEITKWLSGTHNFTCDTLVDIQEVLGIELINIEEKQREQVIQFHIEISKPAMEYELSCLENIEFKSNFYNLYKGLSSLKNTIKVYQKNESEKIYF